MWYAMDTSSFDYIVYSFIEEITDYYYGTQYFIFCTVFFTFLVNHLYISNFQSLQNAIKIAKDFNYFETVQAIENHCYGGTVQAILYALMLTQS